MQSPKNQNLNENILKLYFDQPNYFFINVCPSPRQVVDSLYDSW